MMKILLILGLFKAISANTAKSECSDTCTDFHRSCPAIKDPGYVGQITQAGVVEHLPKKELPTPIDCSNPVYHVWCPYTCGKCVSCERSEIESLKSQVQELKAELAAAAAVTRTTPAPPVDPKPIEVVAAFAVKCLADDFNQRGIELAVDRNPGTAYHSDGTDAPWAKFYIPQSRVTTVKVLNRPDCCGERMNGESVWVCKAEECVKCGEFHGIGTGQWGTMQCGGEQGIQGHYIKISVPAANLQIAQIEVIGGAEKLVGKLKIRGATSSTPLDNSNYIVSRSLDNTETTFYHSRDTHGWVKYEVAQSDITVVKVMNRHDCCQERLMGATVYVCSDQTDQSCKECGKYNTYVGRKQWAVTSCGDGNGINGRFVKVVSAADQVLQIAEVEIFANVPHPVPSSPVRQPAQIAPIASFASKCLGNDVNNWGLQRARDGNANTLYHSDTTSHPFARFYLPKSVVTSVKIQNRADCCGERMTGESVWICGGDFCVKCGQFGTVGNGQWGVVNCQDNRGIEGSYVEVTVPAANLQIAEIQILGEAKERVAESNIISVSSSPILSNTYPMSASYDSNAGTFFHSRDFHGWIKYEVARSHITLIKLQNRVDCCGERLMGAKVFVCTDGNDNTCQECGTFNDPVANGEWVAMPCGDGNGILGRFVKVLSAAHALQITEIEIISNAN